MSTWGEIASNAASFWDGVGGFFGEAKDAIDEAVDWVTQPRKLIQDSEGNYFGIPGMSSEKIKDAAGTAWTRQQEGMQGGSSPFSDIGTTSFLGAQESYESAAKRVQASDVSRFTADAAVTEPVPYLNQLDAIGVNTRGIIEELNAIAKGDAPNEVLLRGGSKQVKPTILLDSSREGFVKNYNSGVITKVDPEKINELNINPTE